MRENLRDRLYVGDRYDDGWSDAGRLMIVGELAKRDTWRPVADIIHDRLAGRKNAALEWIERVLGGPRATPARLWPSVAYAEFLGADAAGRLPAPTRAQREQAANDLFAIIGALNASIVVFLSSKAWRDDIVLAHNYEDWPMAPQLEICGITNGDVETTALLLANPRHRKFGEATWQHVARASLAIASDRDIK